MKLENTHSDIAEYGRRYHFYYNAENGTIVCTTTYKGRVIRGIAKCSPEDNFDVAVGKKLAYLRCKAKFMRKKLIRANKVLNEASNELTFAKFNFRKACEFVDDSDAQLRSAKSELSKFESSLGL